MRSLLQTAQNTSYNLSDLQIRQESSNYARIITLHPSLLDALRKKHIGVDVKRKAEELAFLRKLPKAELHCHLGGVLDAAAMCEAATLHEQEIHHYEKQSGAFTDWRNHVKALIHNGDAQTIRTFVETQHGGFRGIRTAFSGVPEPFAVCGFLSLFSGRSELLETVIYGKYRDPAHFRGICPADASGHRILTPYETLGDVQGSALLQTESIIRFTVKRLVETCREDGVRYVELRCSPMNYTRNGLSALDVYRIIAEELSRHDEILTSGILIIANRHAKMSGIYKHVELIEEIQDSNIYAEKLLGVDLAGNETSRAPAELRNVFLPLMNRCLAITIHAGEAVEADSIWQAVYHLSAERIGHGLTLVENQHLMKKFLNRGIALELCPSSNDQIVGFYDAAYPDEFSDRTYPLKAYLDAGLKVTVNTDNPGISRTSLSGEYLKAARMSEGGLSLLDVVHLVKNGFSAAFADFETRRKLLLESEEQIISLLKKEYPYGIG